MAGLRSELRSLRCQDQGHNPTTSHHCLHHYHQQPRPLGWSADLPFSLSESPSGSCRVRQRWLSAKPHGRFKDDLTAGAPSGNWSFGRASLALFTSNSEDSSLALPPPLFLTLLTYSHMLQTKEPSRASLKTGSPRKGLSNAHAKNQRPLVLSQRKHPRLQYTWLLSNSDSAPSPSVRPSLPAQSHTQRPCRPALTLVLPHCLSLPLLHSHPSSPLAFS